MRSRGFQSSKRARLLIGFAAVAGVATLLYAADDVGRGELETRRERIENMSKVEREELERKLEKFNSLPDARKDSFRTIHEALQDPQDGRNLHDVLLNYDAWLQTLSPWQRDEIRAARTPEERIEIVRHFKSAQDGETDRPGPGPDIRPPNRGKDEPGKRPDRRFRYVRLDREDVSRALDVVEKSLPMSDEDRREVQSLAPAHRHVRVMLTATRQVHDENPEGTRRNWPNRELFDQIVAVLQNERDRTELTGTERAQMRLNGAIFWGVMGEARDELNRLLPDKEQVVRKYISELDESKKKRLLMQDVSDSRVQEDQLAWRYLDEVKHDPFAHDVIQLQRTWFSTFGGPRSGGFGRRSGPYDGKNRGGNFRSRDRRPDDGRPPGKQPGDAPRNDDGPPPEPREPAANDAKPKK